MFKHKAWLKQKCATASRLAGGSPATPEELRKYESEEVHCVDHIPPELRVTTVIYKRDMGLEEHMLEKCQAAQIYIEEIKKRILADHNYEYES